MNDSLFEYKGALYPDYLRRGNASQHIAITAAHFCKGRGLDVGANEWPLPGVTHRIDRGRLDGKVSLHAADYLPGEGWDYIFSSHCLEHMQDPIQILEHWKEKLRIGGTLFLYLPHPDMVYWNPQHCRKHFHIWQPKQMVQILTDLEFVDVIHSERDLAWSFAVVGYNGHEVAA